MFLQRRQFLRLEIYIQQRLQQFKMVNLLIILLLCILGHSHSPMYGCFYNQKINIANATYFNYTMGGYDFGITWTQPQGNITKYAYTLVGYRSELGNSFICFNGSLINVTNTGAVFLFEPQNGSSIRYAIFSIVLVQTCSGYIDLQFIQFQPLQLSKAPANRTSSSQNCRVNLTTPITTDYFNYQISVHLSAFYLTSIGSYMEFSIALYGLNSGVTYLNANMVSRRSYSNVYPRVWFTFILIHMPSFTQQVSTYVNRPTYTLSSSGVTNNINNFYISPVFNQGNFAEECVFSISDIFAYPSNDTHYINYVDYSNDSLVNISTLVSNNTYRISYATFCMRNCSSGYFVTIYGYETCGKCWHFRSGCELCTYSNLTYAYRCTKCFDYYYMLNLNNYCYAVCPVGYFGNNATYKCAPCNSVCHSCAGSINCLVCKIGWPVQGGCTTIQGCQIALSPVICSKCNTEGMFQLVSRSCRCVAGYFLVSHLCTNVVGCVGTTLSQGRTVCLLCDSMKGYVLVNGLCVCKDGFIFNGSTCIDLCGDGKIIVDECDDGNTENGDGCSSTCIIEKNFRCYGGSLNPSRCIYEKFDITLSVSKISKTDMLNQGIFVMSITPAIGSLAQLNYTKALAFSCNQSISIISASYSSGKITIVVDFFEDLEGHPAKVFLTLDRNYFLQANAIISFSMESTSGAKLILTSDVSTLALCKMLLTGVSVLVIVVFAASTFLHKMIGIELIFPLQMVYLVHMVNSNYSQSFGLLKYFGFASWNLKTISQSTANIDSRQQNLVFSSNSQQFSILIVAGLIVVWMLAFAITKAVKSTTQQEETKSKSISSIQRVLVCLYKILLFPFTVSFLPTFFLMSNTHSLHERYTFPLIVQALFPLFMVAASLVFFYEWRVLLVAYEKHSLFQGLPMCNQKHIPVYLSFMLISTLLLSYSYQHQLSSLAIFAAIIELLLFAWMIVGRPYESTFHNVAVLVNLLPAVLFLTYDVLRDYQPALQAEKNEIYLVFAMIGSASLSSLTSIGRILFELYQWKKMEEGKIQKKTQRNEARLKKRQELLNKLERMKAECEYGNKSLNQLDIIYLQKFRKENQLSTPHKMKGDAISAMSAANERLRLNNQLQLKKKLRNRFGQMNSELCKIKNTDALL